MGGASRSPEGEPNRCRVCGHVPAVAPAADVTDATCPECGNLMALPQSLGTKPPRLSPATISRFYRATALRGLETRLGEPAPREVRLRLGGDWSVEDAKKWDEAARLATSYEEFLRRGPGNG